MTTKDGVITSQRDLRLDVLRVIAILGAISIHVVYPIYSRPDFLGGGTWWLATLMNGLARTAIPLFIMISGYLILPKHESAKQRFGRIFHRLLIPLLFWFSVFVAWDALVLLKERSIGELISMVFMSNMFNLYFLVILIGLYAVAPVLESIASHSRITLVRIMTGSFISGMILYLAPYVITPDTTQVNSLTIWFAYLGYFILGYILPSVKFKLRLWLGIFGLGAIITVLFSYLNVYWRGVGFDLFWRSSGVSWFDEYLSPHVILMSAGLFGLIFNWDQVVDLLEEKRWLRWLVLQISSCAFGLYLIHSLVLDWLEHRLSMNPDNLGPGGLLVQLVLKWLMVLIVSYLIASVLIRIRFVKRVLGER